MPAFRAQNTNTRWHVRNTPHHTKKRKSTENLPRFSFLVWCGVIFDYAKQAFEFDYEHEMQTYYSATVIYSA